MNSAIRSLHEIRNTFTPTLSCFKLYPPRRFILWLNCQGNYWFCYLIGKGRAGVLYYFKLILKCISIHLSVIFLPAYLIFGRCLLSFYLHSFFLRIIVLLKKSGILLSRASSSYQTEKVLVPAEDPVSDVYWHLLPGCTVSTHTSSTQTSMNRKHLSRRHLGLWMSSSRKTWHSH